MTEERQIIDAVERAIERFWTEHSYAPTIRNVMAMTGLSKESADQYIQVLERLGKVHKTRAKPVGP